MTISYIIAVVHPDGWIGLQSKCVMVSVYTLIGMVLIQINLLNSEYFPFLVKDIFFKKEEQAFNIFSL